MTVISRGQDRHAYKIGELKFKQLRAEAEGLLGDNFNIREFHDELLSKGALPLDVLEQRIREWMAVQVSNRSKD